MTLEARRRLGNALGAVATVMAAGLAAVAVAPPAHAAPPGAGGVAEARTETSTTVRHADGTRTVTLHAGPVRLREGTRWRPVDLTLVAAPDGVVRPTAVAHDLALTPTGPVVRFAGGGSAALAWTTPLPAPQLAGHRATYPQALPGHDLVVEATSSGFVASLRRTDPAAAPVPPLTLRREGRPAAAGESLAGEPLVETGSAVSRVVAAAPPVGTAPVPFDTTVQTTVLRSDLSGAPDLRVGSYDGTAVARSLLTWDTAALAGQQVTSARLLVHQDWSASCLPRAWEVWSAPAAGPQTRWASRPAADRQWATSTETRGHAACAAGWSGVDVTGLVQAWAAAGAAGGSVELRASDERDPLGWKRFGSAESPHVPHLEVTLA